MDDEKKWISRVHVRTTNISLRIVILISTCWKYPEPWKWGSRVAGFRSFRDVVYVILMVICFLGLLLAIYAARNWKCSKMSFLLLLLVIFVARGWKCSKWTSWGHFWPYVRPEAEMLKISFIDLLLTIYMCAQGLEMLKMSFWGCFWPYVRPGTENAWNLPGQSYERSE